MNEWLRVGREEISQQRLQLYPCPFQSSKHSCWYLQARLFSFLEKEKKPQGKAFLKPEFSNSSRDIRMQRNSPGNAGDFFFFLI